jgi:drug/metabolite transporter (DMT)-like permease
MKAARFNWGILLVALGASLWGTDALLRVPLLPIMSSPAIVLAEHVVLLVYALPAVVLGWPVVRRLRPVQWGAVLLIGWGASGLATVLFTEAFKLGDPTTVILLQKAQPLFAIILARLALGERLTATYWPAFALAMAGAYLLAFNSLDPFWRLPTAPVLAAVYAIGSALLWGAGTVLGRFMLADLPFHTLTGLRFLVALPFLAVISLPQGGLPQMAAGFTQEPVNLILLSLIPGLAGLLFYYRGLRGTPASVATLAELAFPFTAVLIGWLFLNRLPTVTQFIGFGLLWTALLALTWIDASRTTTRAPQQPVSAPNPG